MRNNRVFISAINLKTTEVSGLDELHSVIQEGRQIMMEEFSAGEEKIFLGEKIKLDTSSRFYPSKSNEKVMRAEVVASTVCVGELLSDVNIPENILRDIPLYISTGMCFERQEGDMDWFSKAIQASISLNTIEEKNIKVNHLIPPLISLRTLTNSASSFVAQYCKTAGNNATFGVTSQSAFYALKEAFSRVQNGDSDFAIAGGANRGGLTSFFMFKNFTPSNTTWKECACASFVLLESEESLKKRNKKPLCEITDFMSGIKIPDMLNPITEKPFQEFNTRTLDSDMCIFGGAFRKSESDNDAISANGIWKKTFSLYPLLGNFGAAGLFMNIASSLYFFNLDKHKIIDCVDRDPYKRESLVRLTNII